ncbi:transcription factor IIIB 50 kDa subunit-like isoform X2 [Ischnura elegans]|nr:transcription factor IIIB 50 kDa subunit-like isoform X2 [Ischnura elegans]XP_046384588.1 transcription factor IIIB 50 kDa subunit-like isoform X2 [Ischnura elegans]
MHCPCCGHDGMLFECHHGMDQNVCEQCGTVIESDSYVTDPFQPGLREVPCVYRSQKNSSKDLILLNPKSKALAESYEVMCQLMDRLNLPIAARELATHFLQHSRNFDKRCSIGASVYLSMKRHDIPVTLKYISNYLQVSHFSVGRVMKGLEKRIGASSQSHAFHVNRLSFLIFSQAKFGGCDGGKRRLEMFLNKTEHLLSIIERCPLSVSYQPHIIILAAGYIVWRNLIICGWTTEDNKPDGEQLVRLSKGTVKSYLGEVGIQLSDHSSVYSKVNLISSVLSKFANDIPWMVDKIQSKDMIYTHLEEFLKYSSQMVMLATAGESSAKVEGGPVDSARKRTGTDSTTCVHQLDASGLDTGAHLLVGGHSVAQNQKNSLVFRKVRFTKLMSVQRIHNSGARLKRELPDSEKEGVGSDSVDIVKPGSEKNFPSCLDFP